MRVEYTACTTRILTEEGDWGGSAWRKSMQERCGYASGTYKTSFEFGGMRPGKPLSNMIDPCQRSWWRSSQTLAAPHIRTHDMWKIFVVVDGGCFGHALEMLTGRHKRNHYHQTSVLANGQLTHLQTFVRPDHVNASEREIIPWDGQDRLLP